MSEVLHSTVARCAANSKGNVII